jgi:hypothetical protein
MKTFVATLTAEHGSIRVSLEAENIRAAQAALDLWFAGWIASGHSRPPSLTAIAEVSRPRDATSLFNPEGWEVLR